MPLNLLFLGTPKFAVPSLNAIVDQGHRIKLVVTQPDKPRGRGLKVDRGPVAAAADLIGLPVAQPQKLVEIKDELLELDIDAAVVVAYGKLLPDWLLNIGKFGCVNVHPSLLPKYRGASPIESSILCGDDETGVSIMRLTEGMDEGPIYIQSRVSVADDDNRLSLSNKLSAISAEALLTVLNKLEQGQDLLAEQDHGKATYTKKIEKEDLRISWTEDALTIVNKIRAFSPRPGAYTIIEGKRLKVLKARVCPISVSRPGEIVADQTLLIRAKDSGVCIEELQPEGKRPMTAAEYLRGFRKTEGLIAS